MRSLLAALAVSAAVLATAGAADAQRDRYHGPRITLYSAPYFEGTRITLTGSVPDLNRLGFNDRAQSVRARGRWLLCRGRDFRESCVPVSGDIPSLKPYGMNRRAGSVLLRR